MPIIFAQAILFLPTIFSGFTGEGWARYFTDHTNIVYMIVYSVCVIAFTFPVHCPDLQPEADGG